MDRPNSVVRLNTTFDSSLIQSLARAAAQRCTGGGDFDAIGAVILTYTAFEAFLNEVSQLAQTLVREHASGETDVQDSILERLALVLRVAQDHNASASYRYDLALKVMGASIDPGQGARQSLSTLIKLRNDLVHAKSEETEIYLRPDPQDADSLGRVVQRHKHPRYFQFLEDKGVLANGNEDHRWIYRICSRDVADWACNTVEELAADLVAHAPTPSKFQERLEKHSLGGTIERAKNQQSSSTMLSTKAL
jgi:hypothetical protein